MADKANTTGQGFFKKIPKFLLVAAVLNVLLCLYGGLGYWELIKIALIVGAVFLGTKGKKGLAIICGILVLVFTVAPTLQYIQYLVANVMFLADVITALLFMVATFTIKKKAPVVVKDTSVESAAKEGAANSANLAQKTELVADGEPTTKKEFIPNSKEFRIRCKVCGHVYCYTMGDFRENERLKKKVVSTELNGALTTLFTNQSLGSSRQQEAEMMKMRIKDYTRCPKCNSTNIEEIPDGETIPTAAISDAPAAPAASALDEVKKLKELLDMGVITQEEFDAKKKQLLGL